MIFYVYKYTDRRICGMRILNPEDPDILSVGTGYKIRWIRILRVPGSCESEIRIYPDLKNRIRKLLENPNPIGTP